MRNSQERTFDFQDLQEEAGAWQAENFDNPKAYQPLLGVIEEVGELAHAHLKAEQGMRKGEDYQAKTIDAIGDIIIYLTHYCTLNGVSLQEAVYRTWQEVKTRNWRQYPCDGKTK